MNQEDFDREVLQYEILPAILAKAIREEILLKGGFALRMVTGSPRRTKDVNLRQDPRRMPFRRLQKLMHSAITEAMRSEILSSWTVTEPKQDETVAHWKISGKTPAGSQIHLTVEVSRHGLSDPRFWADVPRPGASAAEPLVSYGKGALSTAETRALLSELRVVARDLSDLGVLIRMEAVPFEEMCVHVGLAVAKRLDDEPAQGGEEHGPQGAP